MSTTKKGLFLHILRRPKKSCLQLGFPGLPTNVLNATVLTASGQPIQLTQGGPQKLIVTQHTGGGQPRLIVPAQQVALLSNGTVSTTHGAAPGGATIGAVTSATVTPLSKENAAVGLGSLNPGRQILQSLSGSSPLTLQPHHQGHQGAGSANDAQHGHHPHQAPRIETHKIISGPIGMSGTPIILQTALTTLP